MNHRKHLFNGSIFHEGDIFTARDKFDNYITYGKTLIECQKEVYNYYKRIFDDDVFTMEYTKKISCWNFSGYFKKDKIKKAPNYGSKRAYTPKNYNQSKCVVLN